MFHLSMFEYGLRIIQLQVVLIFIFKMALSKGCHSSTPSFQCIQPPTSRCSVILVWTHFKAKVSKHLLSPNICIGFLPFLLFITEKLQTLSS